MYFYFSKEFMLGLEFSCALRSLQKKSWIRYEFMIKYRNDIGRYKTYTLIISNIEQKYWFKKIFCRFGFLISVYCQKPILNEGKIIDKTFQLFWSFAFIVKRWRKKTNFILFFNFSIVTKQKVYFVQTPNEKELYDWLYAINPLLAGQIRYDFLK